MEIEKEELVRIVGKEKVSIFEKLCLEIINLYDMEQSWKDSGKKWNYECRFRKGSKTLCGFYFKEDVLGFMIIFGKYEREKVELIRNQLSDGILKTYDEAETYHDGKWVMFELKDTEVFDDLKKLLLIKRKPGEGRHNT